jgi:phosphoenolpyruvate carboxylase
MTIHELLERLDDALDNEDIAQARELLADVRNEIESLEEQTAWRWLRENEPANYDQVLRKLELARDTLTYTGNLELGQLVDIFARCEEHGIPLENLEISEHLGKYREAVAHLNSIIQANLPEDEEREKLREAMRQVRADPNRDATRKRVRSPR